MLQSQTWSKRIQFSEQIRQRQKQQIFRKIRSQYSTTKQIKQKYNEQEQIKINIEFKQLLDKLQKMYQISSSIQCIVENQKIIRQFIYHVKKFQDNEFIVRGDTMYNHQQYQQQITQQDEEMYAWNLKQYDQNFQIKKKNSIKHIYHEQPPILPCLKYFYYLILTIYKHINMDIEPLQHPQLLQQQKNIQQINRKKQIPFNQIILPICFCCINIFSMENVHQFPLSLYSVMLKLTEYASFIDNFHNIFLCKLPKNIKIMFLDQFLRHLKNSPILALNNCHTYTKVLYYAVKQSPKLTNYSIYPYAEYKTYSHRIIEEVSKLNSILSFAVMSNQSEEEIDKGTITKYKNQYKLYSTSILSELCVKSIGNCWKVVNDVNITQKINKRIRELRGLFNNVSGISMKINNISEQFQQQQYNKIEYLICNLNLLVNLTYYDDILSCLNQSYPEIWINIIAMLNRICIQYWINESKKNKNDNNIINNNDIQIPKIFEYAKWNYIVQKLIKCVINFICISDICDHFIEYEFGLYQKKQNTNNVRDHQWINLITQIYNNYYKYEQIRMQCLALFTNVLLVVTKKQIYLPKKMVINHNLCQIQNKYEQYGKVEENCEYRLQFTNILNGCSNLLLQVLKLRNNHKNIILSVLDTLCIIVSQFQDQVRSCFQFYNYSFINKLYVIAEEEDDNIFQNQKFGKKMELHTKDVRMKAAQLLDLLNPVN